MSDSSLPSLFDQAVALHQAGRLDEAEAFYRRALDAEPQHADAWHLMGVLLSQRGNSKAAVDWIRSAIRLRDDVGFYHGNLGNIYAGLGQFSEAIQSYRRAIELEPDLAVTHHNLAEALRQTGAIVQALEEYKRAVTLKPDYAEAQNNLGSLLFEMGQIEAAEIAYKEAQKWAPGEATIRYNSMVLLLHKADLPAWRALTQGFLAEAPLPPLYKHDILIRAAIAAWVDGDLRGLKTLLTDAAGLSGALSTIVSNKNLKNMQAYERFLRLLVAQAATVRPVSAQRFDLIGDSHVLSYAHTQLQARGALLSAQPHLIMGIKAWHLAQQPDNKYKERFRFLLQKCSAAQPLIFSIGEIDCRVDEGILVYQRKSGRDLREVTAQLVRDYVSYVAATRNNDLSTVYFLNVPAPNIQGLEASGLKLSSADRFRLIEVARLFNQALELEVLKTGGQVLDAYRFSVGAEGQASGAAHLDQFHLKPNLLEKTWLAHAS